MTSFKVVHHEKNQENSDLNKLINLELHVACYYHHLAHHFSRSTVKLFESFFRHSNKVELDRAVRLIDLLKKHGGEFKKDKHGVYPKEKTFFSCVHTIKAVFDVETMIYQNVRKLHITAIKLNDQAFIEFLAKEYFTERIESVQKLTDYYIVLQPNAGVRLKWPFVVLCNRRVEPNQATNCIAHEFSFDPQGNWSEAK